MRALSNLILRVRTAADRHSWRKSGRSSSGNYQRKQSADGTARLKKRSRWKQSWTWEGPFGTNEFSAGIALRHGQSRYTRYQIQSDILHSSIFDSASQHQPRTRRNVSTFPHSINGFKVSKDHKKRPAEFAGLWSRKLDDLLGCFDFAGWRESTRIVGLSNLIVIEAQDLLQDLVGVLAQQWRARHHSRAVR